MLDSRGRQLRWRPRNPRDPEPSRTPRVLTIFEILERHGRGTTKYLHSFIGGDFNTLQKLISRLYDWGYLDHFKDQEDSFSNRLRHIIYGNTLKARQALTAAGKESCFVDRNDPFVHRFMGACVGASIELRCKAKGLTYISRNEVLAKKGNPLRIPLPSFGDKSYLEPDDLFGIQYPDRSFRRFAVEIDRGNEPHEGKERHSSIDKKLDYYADVIANRRYHEVWGIPGMMVLIVTTSKARIQNIIETIKKRNDPSLSKRFLLKAYPNFKRDWLVPTDVLTDVLDPWQRADGTTFDITTP